MLRGRRPYALTDAHPSPAADDSGGADESVDAGNGGADEALDAGTDSHEALDARPHPCEREPAAARAPAKR
jgi:hypothetical protein